MQRVSKAALKSLSIRHSLHPHLQIPRRIISFIHAMNITEKELELTIQVYSLNTARSDDAIELNHLCITSRVAPGMQTRRYAEI